MVRTSQRKTITISEKPGRAICGAGIGVFLVWFLVDMVSVLESPGEISTAGRLAGLAVLIGTALLAGALAQLIVGAVIFISRFFSTMSTKRRAFMTAVPSALGLFFVIAPRIVELLSGEWVIDQAWRPAALVGLLILTIVFLLALGRVLCELMIESGQLPWNYGLSAVVLCLVVFLADAHSSLARHYFALHDILAVIGMVAAAGFGSSLLASRWRRVGMAQAAIGAFVLALLVTATLPGESENMQRLIYKSSRLTSRILGRFAPVEDVDAIIDQSILKFLAKRSEVDGKILDQYFPGRRGHDIVLITVDGLRRDFLDASKSATLTPNLARRFEESVVFQNAWAQFPSSEYAIHSMFTGRYPSASILHARQKSSEWNSPSKAPLTLAASLAKSGFSTRAFTSFPAESFANKSAFLVRGFERVENDEGEAGSAPSRVVARALRSLGDDRQDGPPQFLWIHLQDQDEAESESLVSDDAPSQKEQYFKRLKRIDRSLERLFSFLNESQKKRFIILHSDHGEEQREHGGVGHHSTLFEEQIGVPLAISGPGIKPQIVGHPVELVDLPATLCALTGSTPVLADKGHSLLPLIVGTDVGPNPPELVFAQFREPSLVQGSLDSVRDERWKLIHDRQRGHYELFDLAIDPFERNNLAKENAPRLKVMKRNMATMRSYAGIESQADVDDRVFVQTVNGLSVGKPQLESIARVLRRGPGSKPESVVSLLKHNDDRVRRLALLHIATYADGLGHAYLTRQRLTSKGERADEIELGLALLGEEEVLGSLRDRDEQFLGIDRMVLAIARFVSGDTSMGPCVHQFLAHPNNDRDIDTLGIYALMRTRDPWLLPSLYVRTNLGMKFAEHRIAAFETAARMSFDLTSPLIRRFLTHPDREIRRRADAILAQDPGMVEWRQHALVAESFALRARAQGVGPEALELATPLYLSAIEEIAKVRIFDWGYVMELAFLWTVNDRRGELTELLTPHLPGAASSKNSFALELTRRLLTVSETAGAPVRAKLRLIEGQEPKLTESGRVNMLVEVRLAHDSAAIIGSVDRMTEFLGASLLDSRGHPKGEGLVLPVSLSGILPSERVILSVPVFIPENAGNRFKIGIQLGRVDNELTEPLVIDVNR
ncbi:MAG: arylsulfatase A-like enzyme [Planctomycetota bacterium]|jgi:arylsulfatase A-like enzyme